MFYAEDSAVVAVKTTEQFLTKPFEPLVRVCSSWSRLYSLCFVYLQHELLPLIRRALHALGECKVYSVKVALVIIKQLKFFGLNGLICSV